MKRVISLVVTILFTFNNISYATPDMSWRSQKYSSLRELSAGLDGQTAGTLGADLKTANREAFPVKLAAENRDGIDISREPGDARVVDEGSIFADTEAEPFTIILRDDQPPHAVNDITAASTLFGLGINEFVERNRAIAPEDQAPFISEERLGELLPSTPHRLKVQFIEDNDRLVDLAPVSDDVSNPETGLRIDLDIVKALGISVDEEGRLRSEMGERILKGAILLSAISFLHEAAHLDGKSERDAIHAALDFYLTLSEEDKQAALDALKTGNIDSGSTFRLFLESITDAALVEEIEGFDMSAHANTRSALLYRRANEIKALGAEKSEAEARELNDIEATLRWRDKRVSWLMLFERIDPPVDLERLEAIMSDAQAKRKEGELNVDEWHREIYETISDTFNLEVEDRNIFTIAKWANQRGIEILSGRLGRAFENQARLASIAKYVTVTPEVRRYTARLKEFVQSAPMSEESRGQLMIYAGKIEILANQMQAPAYMEFYAALKQFREALLECQVREHARLNKGRETELDSMSFSNVGIQAIDRERARIDKRINALGALADSMELDLWQAEKKDALFVFLIQRISPAGTHKLAKALTTRDVEGGREEDIRDLVRKGGDFAYTTPGQGKNFNVIMFASHIIEAIPMFVKERVLRVRKPDGTYTDIHQREVDQKAMEEFFRNIFAPYFLKNIKHAMTTQHIELARSILFSTPRYNRIFQRFNNLPFDEFMKAIDEAEPGFKDDVAALAALVEQSYMRLRDRVVEYRAQNSCDRVTAVRQVILGENRDTSGQNLMHPLLEAIADGSDISEVISEAWGKLADDNLTAIRETTLRYWDWQARNVPTLHDLTTQAPGLTEAYIQTWLEEEMTILSILAEHPELSGEISAKRAQYKDRLVACTRKILAERRMSGLAEITMEEKGYSKEEDALLQIVSSNPSIADEVAKLAVLIEYAEDTGARGVDLHDTSDIGQVISYLDEHGNESEFTRAVIEAVLALNGQPLRDAIDAQHASSSASYEDAATSVIGSDEGYRADFASQRLSLARGRVLELLSAAHPELKLEAKADSYIRDRKNLNKTTAAKEVLRSHRELWPLMVKPKYRYSAKGPTKAYNLVYAPSKVNLASNELESVRTWPQAFGAADSEAALAAYNFYKLINEDPVNELSTVAAEIAKCADNAQAETAHAFINSIALLVNSVGEGDAQRIAYESTQRGDRMVPYPGEGYGGYCVPKDGLFLTFISVLTQKQKLSDMGIPAQYHNKVIALAKELIRARELHNFDSDFEWEMWAAEHMIGEDTQGSYRRLPQEITARLREYISIEEGESDERILVFNIAHIADVVESVGKPSYDITQGEQLLWNTLAEWGLNAIIEKAASVNRMMPFIKAWMIARHHPKKVNLAAEYKAITGTEANLGDTRYATGLRIFEILTGACDHLIRQIPDEEGQHIARLIVYGFDLESKDEDIRAASQWFMQKHGISADDARGIEKLKELAPGITPPEDIIITADSGIPVDDVMHYTSDRLVSMDAIASAVQTTLQSLRDENGRPLRLSDGQITANAEAFGAAIRQWAKLENNPYIMDKLSDTTIEVTGAKGKVYRYKLLSAIHYLVLKQRAIARSYKDSLQGCDVLNLGVVSGELLEIARENMPMLIALMLNGNPLAEPTLIDGAPGRAGGAPRIYTDRDVMRFFATCENMGKQGRYEAIGWGSKDVDALRETMHTRKERAQSLLGALGSVVSSGASADSIHDAESLLSIIEQTIIARNEAIESNKDEDVYRDWGRWHPRDRWMTSALSNLSAGLPLSRFDFGTWLAMGGAYVLAGKSQAEIDTARAIVENAISLFNQQGAVTYPGPSFSAEASAECAQTLLNPEYIPEMEEFGQEKLVEVSSKAVTAEEAAAAERGDGLDKKAAIAKARRISSHAYRSELDAVTDTEPAEAIERARTLFNSISIMVRNLTSSDERPAEDLEQINASCGIFSARVKNIFSLLMDRYADKYADEAVDSRRVHERLRRDLDEVFGKEGFDERAIRKFLGGYESDGDIAILAQAARAADLSVSRDSSAELDLMTDAIELFYSVYALSKTADYIQYPREWIDSRVFWDGITTFFAETINDHFYEYVPWSYSRGTGYSHLSVDEMYALSAAHHRRLYGYLRGIMVSLSDLRDMPQKDQDLLIGNYQGGAEAIGADFERDASGQPVHTEAEVFWRAYTQLREIVFIMNDGLAATEILETNPDLRKKGFKANSSYPIPVVFDNFDPALIDASNRVNMAFVFPVGRTHVSKLLRAAPAASLERIAKGKHGLNAIINRFAPVKKTGRETTIPVDEFKAGLVASGDYTQEEADSFIAELEKERGRFYYIDTRDGQRVVVFEEAVAMLKDGQFYMNRDEFRQALITCKGYTAEAADAYIRDLQRQGAMIDGRIRVAARFTKEVAATSVVPFHHVPNFIDGSYKEARIPATVQSQYTEWLTYMKSLYAKMIEGTGIRLPREIRWLLYWDHFFSTEADRINAIIEGFDITLKADGFYITSGNEEFKVPDQYTDELRLLEDARGGQPISEGETVRFKGLNGFAQELIGAEEEPIIILKGAEESGARKQKVFLLPAETGRSWSQLSPEDQEVYRETARQLLEISRQSSAGRPQDVVVQRVIRINPEFWASEGLMDEFTKRRIIERSSAVARTKYPRTPYYSSFRIVPSSSRPDRPYDMTHPLVVMNTEIATNVGRGGSLEPLIAQWIQENFQGVLLDILKEDAGAVMQAMQDSAPRFAARFREKFGPIGSDLLGTPYSWAPFLLLDFLAEPVFEREGKVVDIEPKYDTEGNRIGSDIILEDESGERFVGQIKTGKEGWRIYLVEPNTGIGQIDRDTLRKEELEVRAAAKEARPVDWQAIEGDDYTILNNWADTAEAYGQALSSTFGGGGGFFSPSGEPTPNSDVPLGSVGLDDYKEAHPAVLAQDSNGPAMPIDRAVTRAREKLGMSQTDKFDEVSLSVLIKYYVIESLAGKYSAEDTRRIAAREGLDAEILRPVHDDCQISPYRLKDVLTPLCGDVLDIEPDNLSKILEAAGYAGRLSELAYAHYLSALNKEVEVIPDAISPDSLKSIMGDKRYVLGYLSLNNPVVVNEAYALMADSDIANSEIGVVGSDMAKPYEVLALVQLPGHGRKRLVRVGLTEPMPIDSVWRDETTLTADTELVAVNPRDVTIDADSKSTTLRLLNAEGVNVPTSLYIPRHASEEGASSAVRDFLDAQLRAHNDAGFHVFISPDKGTQGIGTSWQAINRENFDYLSGVIISRVKDINRRADAILRVATGNVRYGQQLRAIDLRLNVAMTGYNTYGVESEYAVIAPASNPEIASVRLGGEILNPIEAYRNLTVTLRNGQTLSVELSDDDLQVIRAEAVKALEALNEGRPEGKMLLFAGVDIKLNATIDGETIRITPVVLEVNARPAGLSHSYMPVTSATAEGLPQVTTNLWGYLSGRIEAQAASPRTAPTGDIGRDVYDRVIAQLTGGRADKLSGVRQLIRTIGSEVTELLAPRRRGLLSIRATRPVVTVKKGFYAQNPRISISFQPKERKDKSGNFDVVGSVYAFGHKPLPLGKIPFTLTGKNDGDRHEVVSTQPDKFYCRAVFENLSPNQGYEITAGEPPIDVRLPKTASTGNAVDLQNIAEVNSELAKNMTLADRVDELTDAFMGRNSRSVAGKAFMDWVYDPSIWDEQSLREKAPAEISPEDNPLIRTVTEHVQASANANDIAIRKLNLGLFYLSKKLNADPGMADAMYRSIGSIRSAINTAYADTYDVKYLIWLGMGGSAEDKYLCQACGVYDNGQTKVFVLDDTDPAALDGILDEMVKSEKAKAESEGEENLPYDILLYRALKNTLVMVQALGMSSYEPVINAKFGLQPLFDYYMLDGTLHFRGMTIDGSRLDNFMRNQGYGRLPHQPDDKATLSGRHDGPLSYGALIPLILNGIDINKWIKETELSDKDVEEAMNLAAWIIANVERGRNKITLFLPDEWKGAGLWIKQLFEESLGKQYEFGVKIIIDEEFDLERYRRSRERYDDRAFLSLEVPGLTNSHTAQMEKLSEEGFSVKAVQLDVTPQALRDKVAPAKLMQFLHHSLFPIAYSFGVCAVDQPPVEGYKSIVELFEREGLENNPMWRRFNREDNIIKRGGISLNIWPIMDTTGSKRGAIAVDSLNEELQKIQRLFPEFDIDDPALVYAVLHLMAAERRDFSGNPAFQYGGLTYYGDLYRTEDGRAMYMLLEDAAGLYRDTMHMPADVGKGPEANHTYHAMDKAWRHGFITAIMPLERKGIPNAPDYPGKYLTEQWFATMLALNGYRPSDNMRSIEWAGDVPGFVVGLSIESTDAAGRAELKDFFDRAREAVSYLSVVPAMLETAEGMEFSSFDTGYEPGWDMLNLENQRLFFNVLMRYISANEDIDAFSVFENYLRWLMKNVFIKMQAIEGGQRAYENRLWPNQLMEYAREALLAEGDRAEMLRGVFSAVVDRTLPELLVYIADNNLDLWHRYLTDVASDESKRLAIGQLEDYANMKLGQPPAEMVKAETAFAIMSDILRHDFQRPDAAADVEARIKEVDKGLYAVYKMGFVNNLPQQRPHLVEGAENRVFIGLSPNRIAWSSQCGADARYNILLDKDGGRVVNAPAALARESWQEKAIPAVFAQRTNEVHIILRAISDMVTTRPTDVTIGADNIRDIYCPRDGQAFGDIKTAKDETGAVMAEADPLSFLKYGLFFTGIIGSGIDNVPDSVISRNDKARAKRDPIFLAQLYLDRCPEQALEDIRVFMHGGGISIIADSHLAPTAAGFSSSSAVTIGLLEALYEISGQTTFVENPALCSEMALIFENDLGRGTGPQDTTGPRSGIKDIRYNRANGGVMEDVLQLSISDTALAELERRTVIFRPGIGRAASGSIGERQIAYLLREPDKFEAIQRSKAIHHSISEALEEGELDELGELMWEYTLIRKSIHASALPDYMEEFFNYLIQKRLIFGGELAGAMGAGSSAILIATDYGLDEVADGLTRLEAELRSLIADAAPIAGAESSALFNNAALNYVAISERGPHAETRALFPLKEINTSGTEDEMGKRAAEGVFEGFIDALGENEAEGKDYVVMNFAAAPSQDAFLRNFVRIVKARGLADHGDEDYYARRIIGVHLDEYEGISADNPASFNTYLKLHLVDRLNLGEFYFLSDNPDNEAYMGEIARLGGIDITICGIGENAHIGFNDPPADLMAEGIVRVELDKTCRTQQVRDHPGIYNPQGLEIFGPDGSVVNEENLQAALSNVPKFARTMTVRSILSAKRVYVVIPRPQKADAVKNMVVGQVDPEVPATAFYTHPHIKIYLDRDSGAELTSADITLATIPVSLPGRDTAARTAATGDAIASQVGLFLSEQPANLNTQTLTTFQQQFQALRDQISGSTTIDTQLRPKLLGQIDDILWAAGLSKETGHRSRMIDAMVPVTDELNIAKTSAVVLNDAEIPETQRAALEFLRKSSPHRAELIERLGINLVLASEYVPGADKRAHMIVISRTKIDKEGLEKARYLNVQSKYEGAFLPVAPIIVFAKGLLVYDLTRDFAVKQSLLAIYGNLARRNSGKLMSELEALLTDFIDQSVFVLKLPKPVPVNQDYYDKLQRISLQALIAA